MEQNEHDIEDWYFKHQGKKSLKDYLCAERALRNEDSGCLNEKLKGETGKKRSKKKKDEL